MLMLYLFKVEVFDLGLNYPYTTDCVVIADTNEDRSRLIRRQFSEQDGSSVKRSVLLGARSLTIRETKLLENVAGTRDRAWLMTRLPSSTNKRAVRHLPRLYNECDMLELELVDRNPAGFDSTPLTEDQYMYSVWFSKVGEAVMPLRVAA